MPKNKYQYSPSTRGFYIEGLNSVIPADVVGIPEDEYLALLTGQNVEFEIVPGQDGRPELKRRAGPTPEKTIIDQIAALESSITPRRLREAVLGEDGGWLADVENKIKSLRSQIKSTHETTTG